VAAGHTDTKTLFQKIIFEIKTKWSILLGFILLILSIILTIKNIFKRE